MNPNSKAGFCVFKTPNLGLSNMLGFEKPSSLLLLITHQHVLQTAIDVLCSALCVGMKYVRK